MLIIGAALDGCHRIWLLDGWLVGLVHRLGDNYNRVDARNQKLLLKYYERAFCARL